MVNELKEIELKLPEPAVFLILDVLSQLPYRQSAQLISVIEQQIRKAEAAPKSSAMSEPSNIEELRQSSDERPRQEDH